MARNKINFTIVGGGLLTPPVNDDHITLLIGTGTVKPANYGTASFKAFRSLTQVESAGITGASDFKLDHYAAKEFFRISPNSTLYIGYRDGDFTADEVRSAADGKIRFIGKYGVAADRAKLNQLAVDLLAQNVPVYGCVLGLHIPGSDWVLDGLPDTTTENNSFVSTLIAGDGHAHVISLGETLDVRYVANLGAVLGLRANASVHESLMWREKFNASNGEWMESIVLADRSAWDNDTALLDTLHDKGYLFFEKEQGLSGSFLNDSHTAVTPTDDFCKIERNASIYKCLRLVNATLGPDKGRPLYVESSGTLSPETTAYFKAKCDLQISRMVGDGELSAGETIIDATQNVLSTSGLDISLKLLPVGVARDINVKMRFTTSLG